MTYQNGFKNCNENHEHCYHTYRGVLHMVVPDGHVVQKCCSCSSMRTIHADHMNDESLPKCCDDDGIDRESKCWNGYKIAHGDGPKLMSSIDRAGTVE